MSISLDTLRKAYKAYLVEAPEQSFQDLVHMSYQFHREQNAMYKKWCDTIGTERPDSIEKIPYLPIQFFKTRRIGVGEGGDTVFTSSGTSGSTVARHYVPDVEIYKSSFRSGWKQFYGDVHQTCILGLLPSYLERKGSSLIYMVDDMIRASKHPDSGFYLADFDALYETLCGLREQGTTTILIGVSFALLDFVEQKSIDFPELIVMETGGMKGRRKELTRSELHAKLSQGFGVDAIHSEYGMTELLSQGYSQKDGIFTPATTMRCLLREMEDPFAVHQSTGKSGLINCVDVSNIYSCPFIATDDIGVLHEKGRFSVLGRMDYSDVRGCNLMIPN